MNVVFHTVASLGIGHVAARGLRPDAPGAFQRGDTPTLIGAFAAGVLSHGVLDGLKHGYPIPSFVDPPLALLLFALWCALIAPRYRLLFAIAFAAAVLPDVVDLGPGVTRRLLGWPATAATRRHLFPWHWSDGSGALYPLSGGAPVPGRAYLDVGRNQAISITNHAIVLFFAAAAVLSNRRPLRRRE